jgi:hypothetical protein
MMNTSISNEQIPSCINIIKVFFKRLNDLSRHGHRKFMVFWKSILLSRIFDPISQNDAFFRELLANPNLNSSATAIGQMIEAYRLIGKHFPVLEIL